MGWLLAGQHLGQRDEPVLAWRQDVEHLAAGAVEEVWPDRRSDPEAAGCGAGGCRGDGHHGRDERDNADATELSVHQNGPFELKGATPCARCPEVSLPTANAEGVG